MTPSLRPEHHELGLRSMGMQSKPSVAQRVGCELSVVQAPMAGVQDARLTVAVSNAGGLGSLPGALLSNEQLLAELELISRKTSNPYNVNFFVHETPDRDAAAEQRWVDALAHYADELGVTIGAVVAGREPFDHLVADVLEPFRPPVVSFHFGLPDESLLQRVKSWGSIVFSTATTVAEAQWLEGHGADVVIAQGLEAGGHRGMFLDRTLTTQVGLFALLPQIASAVDIPVIAAGGVSTPAATGAASTLGASGVQAGTAYLLCDEATTAPLHRTALQSDRAAHTALTNVFTGRPARSIVNRLVREVGPISTLTPPFPLAAGPVSSLRAHAELIGDDSFTPLWSGQNGSSSRAVSASKITRWLGQE